VTRRVVWSDAKVLGLAGSFIPGADDIDRPWGDDPAVRRALNSIRKLKHWTDPNTGDTANGQGIYIARPTGELLEWASSGENSLGDRGAALEWNDLVAEMMKRAIGKWGRPLAPAALPESPLAAERNYVSARHAGSPMLLRFTSRDLPRPPSSERTKWSLDWYRAEWNLNYASLSREEARALAPTRAAKGERYEVPEGLARRFARDYLRDNVHGTPPIFTDRGVRKARLSGEVLEVAASGAVAVRLEGEVLTDEGGFGFEARLAGRAAWSPSKGRFTSFELVAAGPRRGAVHHSGRGPWYDTPVDLGPAPMGILCQLIEVP